MASEVTFTLSEADYSGGIRDSYMARLFTAGTAARLSIGILFCVAVGIGASWLDGRTDSTGSYAAGFALLGATLFALIYALAFLGLKRRSRRLYRQQKMLHQPFTYRWTEEGLEMEAPRMRSFHPWPDFHRWSLSRSAILLFLNDQLFFVLPRRVLSAEDLQAIESSLTAAGVGRL